MAINGGGGDLHYTFTPTNTFGAIQSVDFTQGHWNSLDTTVACVGGHKVSGDLIEYADGLFVGHCAQCLTRVQIEKIPGGVSWMKAGHFIAGALGLEEDDTESASGLLAQLKELEADIAAEERKLEQAKKLIKIARSTVMKRAAGAKG